MFDPQIKQLVIALFGEESYSENQLNKKHIANQLFKDESKRMALEEVLHPRVRKEFESWALKQEAPYVINESALLFEKKLDQYFDKVILVNAPLVDRESRVEERDKVLKSDIKARIDLQNSSSKNEKLSDFVINNDNLSSLNSKCLKIHNILTKNTII